MVYHQHNNIITKVDTSSQVLYKRSTVCFSMNDTNHICFVRTISAGIKSKMYSRVKDFIDYRTYPLPMVARSHLLQ